MSSRRILFAYCLVAALTVNSACTGNRSTGADTGNRPSAANIGNRPPATKRPAPKDGPLGMKFVPLPKATFYIGSDGGRAKRRGGSAAAV
jgi:hypothetical protein